MVSVYPLDLEYFHQITDLNNPTVRDHFDRTVRAQLELLNSFPLERRKHTLVLGTILWEVYNLDSSIALELLGIINQQVSQIGAKFHVVTLTNHKMQFQNAPCGITFFDFFALRTHQCCVSNNQELNQRWNSESNKCLFLMGKYYKPHRIGLLYRLYKHGLLTIDKCNWSLYQSVSFDEATKYIPEYLNFRDDINDFLTQCYRTLDEIDVKIRDTTNSHYGGFPFDCDLYKTSNLSLISETLIDNRPFTTEKTYRAIINHHPFVLASSPGHLQSLRENKFYTFNEFMTVPDYDTIESTDYRLDAIATNVKNFNPSKTDVELIAKMTEHNSSVFYDIVNNESTQLQKMLADYGVTDSWENVIPWKDTTHNFLNWQFYYQAIKDPSWPSCHTVEDCIKLSPEIQAELRTVFDLDF